MVFKSITFSPKKPQNTKAELVIQIDELKFISPTLHDRSGTTNHGSQVLHATSRNAAKLLMTPTRDALIRGPNLCETHRRIGWYLATEVLSELVGLEENTICHVQGHNTSGFRLSNEEQTSIIALMRGEPMALGVNDVLPGAMFIHAKSPGDVLRHHVDGQRTVILVDSVVNSGKTVVEFAQHIYALYPTVRIVVIAGVVQAECVSGG